MCEKRAATRRRETRGEREAAYCSYVTHVHVLQWLRLRTYDLRGGI